MSTNIMVYVFHSGHGRTIIFFKRQNTHFVLPCAVVVTEHFSEDHEIQASSWMGSGLEQHILINTADSTMTKMSVPLYIDIIPFTDLT